MTFNPDSDIRGGRVSKRGRNVGMGVGGGSIGVVLVVLLISQLTGVDLTGVVQGGGGAGPAPVEDQALERCLTGEDANADVDCRMQAAATSLDDFWATQLDGYTAPEMVLFSQSVSTRCGNATSAVGPFYCPPDQTVYIDTSFYDELRSRFGASAGPLAQLYVVAHEWGHHIQELTGTMDQLDRSRTGPTSDGVRLELQADCYAGAWVGAASTITDDQGRTRLEPVTEDQLRDAIDAAEAIGDDRIQQQTQGQVQPETWTHGSSEQRVTWFQRGVSQGVGACDTFSASDAELAG
ncbi:KPN_02809 family neutral zinc metallopeptidase [Auraticoccus monumenti]|uniref:Neutral zinc metallopeptidase n=1 Tax=Auraticoccus monumenti TaxID=675864 RepID=A0A1G7DVL3_9ACTN|nr:neutral zinc metallopeptidase [Auraticoccus monumenti]SDE55422.1 hypothetical protein SAMN04489747_3727 [Auraticoccus monumenti]